MLLSGAAPGWVTQKPELFAAPTPTPALVAASDDERQKERVGAATHRRRLPTSAYTPVPRSPRRFAFFDSKLLRRPAHLSRQPCATTLSGP